MHFNDFKLSDVHTTTIFTIFHYIQTALLLYKARHTHTYLYINNYNYLIYLRRETFSSLVQT